MLKTDELSLPVQLGLLGVAVAIVLTTRVVIARLTVHSIDKDLKRKGIDLD